MIGSPERVVAKARTAVGTRFRPQGRNPQTGLDCVGLATWAFDIPAETIRGNYRLGGAHFAELERELTKRFSRAGFEGRPADLWLCRISSRQAHLSICCGQSFVHADARLRRVVETPGRPPWPVIAAFRIKQTHNPG